MVSGSTVIAPSGEAEHISVAVNGEAVPVQGEILHLEAQAENAVLGLVFRVVVGVIVVVVGVVVVGGDGIFVGADLKGLAEGVYDLVDLAFLRDDLLMR